MSYEEQKMSELIDASLYYEEQEYLESMKIKSGDWVICPLTKDDRDKPTIVAKVISVDDNVLTIQLKDGNVTIPRNYCRVVYPQFVNG